MNNTALRNFYTNETERETVKLFMIECLKEMAVERTFDGKDVKGIQESRELIDKMFDKLKQIYGKVEPPKIISSR